MSTSRLSVPVPSSRPSSSSSSGRVGDESKEIWSSLLNSVSSHKSIPTRNLLVMGRYKLYICNANYIGGGTKGIGEFIEGLRITSRQLGGGKESHTKHKRKRSGVPTQDGTLEGTLALGYTYLDILDEENDGIFLYCSV